MQTRGFNGSGCRPPYRKLCALVLNAPPGSCTGWCREEGQTLVKVVCWNIAKNREPWYCLSRWQRRGRQTLRSCRKQVARPAT